MRWFDMETEKEEILDSVNPNAVVNLKKKLQARKL